MANRHWPAGNRPCELEKSNNGENNTGNTCVACHIHGILIGALRRVAKHGTNFIVCSGQNICPPNIQTPAFDAGTTFRGFGEIYFCAGAAVLGIPFTDIETLP